LLDTMSRSCNLWHDNDTVDPIKPNNFVLSHMPGQQEVSYLWLFEKMHALEFDILLLGDSSDHHQTPSTLNRDSEDAKMQRKSILHSLWFRV